MNDNTSGKPFPLLGMGTWGMGGKYTRDEGNADESVELLSYGFDLGFRLVDVAELYGEGLTEELVGRALRGRKRDALTVISKVWKDHLRFDDVLTAAEGSLRRLGTPYIDLYLIHWPNEAIPLRETMRALEVLVERKLVRAIGVSNFSLPLLEEAQANLVNTPLAVHELEYSLASRSAEHEMLPFCQKHGIHVIAHRPFAKGALLGTISEALATLAQRYKKTPAELALNWIVRQGISAIPKAGSKEHLRENIGALGWNLTDEDARSLGSMFS
ncbi:MAG: aldo/keto reductase [Candidatus Taylorbacteria bacterium]|nr:aldo/keto reductase [Candidatus Taylorbacteria bacterium]